MTRVLELLPFARDAEDPGLRLTAAVARTAGLLTLRWMVVGAAAVEWPALHATPGRMDRLWESTCFEAFVAPVGGTAYWEINVSPAGHWNVYRFDGYRDGMRPEWRVRAPAIHHLREGAGPRTIVATVDLRPVVELAGALDVGVSAVLGRGRGRRTFWALRHPAPEPDFHARESFAVRLPAGEDR